MNTSQLSLILACLVASTLNSTALAQSKWYAGVSAGTSSSDLGPAELNRFRDEVLFYNLVTSRARAESIDESDTSWSVFAGRTFNRHLSVEAAYVDLGDVSYRTAGELGFFTRFLGGPIPPPSPIIYYPGSFSVIDVEHSAVSLKLVGRLPLSERFDIHAHVGGAYVMTDFSTSTMLASDPVQRRSYDDSSSNTSLAYGLGTAFQISPSWGLSLDWHRYNLDEKESTLYDIETRYDTITLALIFSFGSVD